MKNEISKIDKENIQAIERAAWYARLAFGIQPDADNVPAAKPLNRDHIFQVMP